MRSPAGAELSDGSLAAGVEAAVVAWVVVAWGVVAWGDVASSLSPLGPVGEVPLAFTVVVFGSLLVAWEACVCSEAAGRLGLSLASLAFGSFERAEELSGVGCGCGSPHLATQLSLHDQSAEGSQPSHSRDERSRM